MQYPTIGILPHAPPRATRGSVTMRPSVVALWTTRLGSVCAGHAAACVDVWMRVFKLAKSESDTNLAILAALSWPASLGDTVDAPSAIG
jgi:hypothetical protein